MEEQSGMESIVSLFITEEFEECLELIRKANKKSKNILLLKIKCEFLIGLFKNGVQSALECF
jgi:hypothetical protein